MLQWAYGSINLRKAIKKCITSMMSGFTMLDVNQIIFSPIIKAQGRCYAFGRHCRRSTGQFAASKHQPSDTRNPWWAQLCDVRGKSKPIRQPENLNCSFATFDILQCKPSAACNASGTRELIWTTSTGWIFPLCFLSALFLLLFCFFFFLLLCSRQIICSLVWIVLAALKGSLCRI